MNSTIAYNDVASGGAGGGLDVNGGTAILDNSILALNTSDIAGTVSSASANNLIGTGGSGGLVNGVHGNLVGVANPGLDPNGLQNNGGPTQTIAVLPGSPAIGAGSDNIPGVTVPSTDQRGVSRPSDSIDIGAFQDRGFRLTLVAGSSPQSTSVNTAFPNPLAVTVISLYGDPVAGGVITFTVTPAKDGASATLSASTATISADGQASVTATANGVSGGYEVTASAAGARRTPVFSLTNQPAKASSMAVGLGDGSVPVNAPVRLGTSGPSSPGNGQTSHSSAARPALRAEVRLAFRGRGWSLGTSARDKIINQRLIE